MTYRTGRACSFPLRIIRPGGILVKASDLWFRGRAFNSQPFHYQVMTSGTCRSVNCYQSQSSDAIELRRSHWPCITDLRPKEGRWVPHLWDMALFTSWLWRMVPTTAHLTLFISPHFLDVAVCTCSGSKVESYLKTSCNENTTVKLMPGWIVTLRSGWCNLG